MREGHYVHIVTPRLSVERVMYLSQESPAVHKVSMDLAGGSVVIVSDVFDDISDALRHAEAIAEEALTKVVADKIECGRRMRVLDKRIAVFANRLDLTEIDLQEATERKNDLISRHDSLVIRAAREEEVIDHLLEQIDEMTSNVKANRKRTLRET